MNGTNQLFVGGSFSSVGGSLISANNIASWNGNSWSILGSNSTNNGVNGQINSVNAPTVYALAMNGTNQLFVGGSFSSVDGGSISANNIGSWNGNSWNFLGIDSATNGVGLGGRDTVYALAMNGTNQLFVGGSSSISILAWDGNSWNSNIYLVGTVNALAMNGTQQLFVGGSFWLVGGSIFANNIASWNGNSWSILGNSANNGVGSGSDSVYALAMNGTNRDWRWTTNK